MSEAVIYFIHRKRGATRAVAQGLLQGTASQWNDLRDKEVPLSKGTKG